MEIKEGDEGRYMENDMVVSQERLFSVEAQGRLRDRIGRWKALIIAQQGPETAEQGDSTLYSGSGGLALAFWQLGYWEKRFPYISPTNSPNTRLSPISMQFDNLHLAVQYINKAVQVLSSKRRSEPVVTFLCGEAGVYAVAAVIYHTMGNQLKSEEFARKLLKYVDLVLQDNFDSDELLYGRAGFLYACLFVNKGLGKQIIPETTINALADEIIKSGKRNSKGGDCPLVYPWYGSNYLGAAHGTAGILNLLLDVPHVTSNEGHMHIIQSTIDYIVGNQFPSGNFPGAMNDKDDVLVQWCHGAPGYLTLLCKAASIFGPKYLKAAEKACECVWRRGLLKKGVGLCHGIGGNGYSFLYMYKHTCNEMYLNMALEFALIETDRKLLAAPDNPFSLFEGMAGGMLFVANVLYEPHHPSFPSIDFPF